MASTKTPRAKKEKINLDALERRIEARRFQLKRLEDASEFSDGTCVIKWKTSTSSIGIYHSDVEMIHIHGHGGKTVIEWIDESHD